MYPVIASSYVIRGVRQEPYLAKVSEFSLIPLEDDALTSIIGMCDGRNSLSTLAQRHGVTIDEMHAFLKKFEASGALNFVERPAWRDVIVALGSNRPWLREVHIDITNRCNQARWCRHCFRGDKLNRTRDVSIEVWLSLLDDLSKMGTYVITLSGGEPLLRHDLSQLARFIVTKGMFLGAIFTNGLNWSKTMEEIVSILVSCGMGTTFYISLDGSSSELHDANRGAGAFAKTTGFIRRLVELRAVTNAKFKIAINSQITSENVKTLVSWYRFISELGVDRWRITSGRITGRLAEHHELLPQWDELFTEYEELIRHHIKDRGADALMRLNIDGFFNTRMLDEKVALTFSGETRICDYKEHACSIEPNGDVQFCTSWGARCFGNVFAEGISRVWHSMELQSLKAMKISEIDECRECELLEFCGGGCRLVAPRLKQKDLHSCEKYRRFKDRILPIMREEGIRFMNERNDL